ncbi:hypothetical protein CEXT_891 [Caerostris extrusa]|uniref:Uncharacterized protein n=1 Tax=Caerostris extrusa TaxID=172846 RepID=A0AAV4Y577_CAEEX|nr:hypothetical protein CEXT_891 [Caerostris extrusa]
MKFTINHRRIFGSSLRWIKRNVNPHPNKLSNKRDSSILSFPDCCIAFEREPRRNFLARRFRYLSKYHYVEREICFVQQIRFRFKITIRKDRWQLNIDATIPENRSG